MNYKTEQLPEDKYYIFFDAECPFCHRSMIWILKNDKKDIFRFISLNSHWGQNFLSERNLPTQNIDTIYLWKPKSFYLKKSQAVENIALLLGGKYQFLAQINFIPTFIMDKIYDLIAKNRKNIQKNCPILTEKEKEKFYL